MEPERLSSPWQKIAPKPAEESHDAAKDDDQQHEAWNVWQQLAWRLLDIFAWLLWIYAFLKVFVGDFDRFLVANLAPQLRWLVDYRGVVFLIGLSLVLVFAGKGKWRLAPIYVATFPLVVILWKVPRFIYKRNSWELVFGFLHATVAIVGNLRYSVPVITAVLLAGLLIIGNSRTLIIWASFAALLVCWLLTLVRVLVIAVRPSRFLTSQSKFFHRILSGDRPAMFELDDWMRDPGITSLTESQAKQVVSKAGMGLIAYRATQFWAMKLNDYRRGSIPVVFGVAVLSALLLYALITFTLVNAALFQLDPHQYSYSSAPALPTFAYYSVAALYANEISALKPDGSISYFVNIIAGLSTGFVVLVVMITLILGLRQSREDEVAREEIQALQLQAESFAVWLGEEHGLALDELQDRVAKMGFAFMDLILYLTRSLSEDREDEESHSTYSW